MRDLNEISYKIIGCAYKVHRNLGPGLLESTYEFCLMDELLDAGLSVKRQVGLPLIYSGKRMEVGYRLDILVENLIIVEIKAIDACAPIHKAQLLTYLKLSGLRLGLLINFNETNLQNGITRLVYG